VAALPNSPFTIAGRWVRANGVKENVMSRGLAVLVSVIVFWHAAAVALSLIAARIPLV
jgi:hypothetical protein